MMRHTAGLTYTYGGSRAIRPRLRAHRPDVAHLHTCSAQLATIRFQTQGWVLARALHVISGTGLGAHLLPWLGVGFSKNL